MPMTAAQKRKAFRALNKKLEEQYKPEEIDTMEWYVDEEGEDWYRWKFLFPGDGKVRTFTYILSTNSVVIRRIG